MTKLENQIEKGVMIVTEKDNIVARFSNIDSTSIDYLRMFGQVDDNGVYRCFEIFEDYNPLRKTTKILINRKLYNAVEEEEFNPFEVFKEHGLDIDVFFDSLKLISDEDIVKYENIANEYSDMLSWQKELASISDGYNEIYNSEIIELVTDYYRNFNTIFAKFRHAARINYGAGEYSLAQDLSVVKGVKKYYWVNMVEKTERNLCFMYVDNKFNKLSKVFEKDFTMVFDEYSKPIIFPKNNTVMKMLILSNEWKSCNKENNNDE